MRLRVEARRVFRNRLGAILVLAAVSTQNAFVPDANAVGREAVVRGAASSTARAPGLQDPSGAYRQSLPFLVPPGPGGLQPKIALEYSSAAPDGIAGVGWHLSFGSIECSSRFGAPDFDACDHFELNGALLEGPYPDGMLPSADRYYPFEASYERVRFLADGSWEVTAKNGERRIYGGGDQSRVRLNHAASGSGAPTVRWLLSEVVDVFGNVVTYDYETLHGAQGDPELVVPVRVSYAQGTRRISFEYEDRPDVLDRFIGGHHDRMSRRLREVRIESGKPLGVNYRVELTYAQASDYSTRRSRLAQIQRFGSDCTDLSRRPSEAGCTGLPAETFTYTDNRDTIADEDGDQYATSTDMSGIPNEILSAITPASADLFGFVFLSAYGFTWGDVNGDGLDDFLTGSCSSHDFPCTGAGEGQHAVYLNDGNGGWEQTPDPAWTAALRNLRFDAPSLKLARDPGFTNTWGPGPDEGGAPYCLVEPSTYESAVFFGNVEGWYVPRIPFAYEDGPAPGVFRVREIAGPSNFESVDLNGDGRMDLVMSVRVGGAWKKAAEEAATPGGLPCHEPLPVQTYHEAVGRVVFLNTGDPSTGGWVRAPELEETIPPFVAVEVQDHMSPRACDSIGLTGSNDDYLQPPEIPFGEHEGYCRGLVNFDAQFVELNGDGRPDLLVAEPLDRRFMVQERTNPVFGGPDWGHCPTGPMHGYDELIAPGGANYGSSIRCHNPASTRAYVQVRDGQGVYRWEAAPQFDLEAAAPGAPAHHVHIAFVKLPFPGSVSGWVHPQNFDGGFHTSDDGVRFVDLNGDGLTDVVWRDPHFDPDPLAGGFDPAALMDPLFAPHWVHGGGPSVHAGVLLNTGNGWCASWVADECPEAESFLPPRALATVGAGLLPSTANMRVRYGAGALGAGSSGLVFAELNGDGFVDVALLGPDPRSWLQSPGATGSRWVEDATFAPPPNAKVAANLNGDRVVDWLDDGFRALNASSLPDLLKRHDNGRGASVEVTYLEALAQRDDAFETAAEREASDDEVTGGTDARAITRWSAQPVVVRVRNDQLNFLREEEGVAHPVSAVTTYHYARPRWDPVLRRSAGFGGVRRVLPDGSSIESVYAQSMGLRERLRKRSSYDETGQRIHIEENEYDVVLGHLGSGPNAFTGRLLETRSRNEYEGAPGAERIMIFDYQDPARPLGAPPAFPYPFVFATTVDRPTGVLRTERTPEPVDADAGLIGRIASVASYDGHGTKLASSSTTYWSTTDGVSTTLPSRVSRDVFDRSAGVVDFVSVVAFAYDEVGNRVRETIDPGGLDRESTWCYDGGVGCAPGHGSRSLVVGHTNALGIETTTTPHPVFALPASEIPGWADQPSRTYAYDAFGRMVSRMITPAGLEAGGEHDVLLESIHYLDRAPSSVTEIAYPEGAGSLGVISTTVLDGRGEAWKKISVLPGTPMRFVGTAFAFDPLQRVVRTTVPTPCSDFLCQHLDGVEVNGTVSVFDSAGRLERRSTPNGGILLQEYAAATIADGPPGLLADRALDVVRRKEPGGGIRHTYFDEARTVRVDVCADPADPTAESAAACLTPETTLYDFAATGEISRIFDPVASSTSDFTVPGPHVLAYEHDSLGRPVVTDEPNAGPVRSTYDAAGSLASVTNARGQTRTMSYDALGRLRFVKTPEGEADVQVLYPSGHLLMRSEMAVDFSGSRPFVAYANRFEYDALGRVRKKNTGRFGAMATHYDWDNLGRPTRIRHPILDDGIPSTTVYEYEGAFVRRVCDAAAGSFDCDAPGSTDYVSWVDYDGLGRPASIQMPSGTRTIDYDAATLEQIGDRFESSPVGSYFVERTYQDPSGGSGYEPSGQLRHLQMTSSLSDLDGSQAFEYDAQGRLASWTPNAATSGGPRFAYAYDPLGNLTTRMGEVLLHENGSAPHQVTHVDGDAFAYTYDADGNLVEKTAESRTTFYTYDSANRLVCAGSAPGGCEVLSVTYDLAGNRLKEVTGGATVRRFAGEGFVHTEGLLSERETFIDIVVFGERLAVKHVVGGRLAGTSVPFPRHLPWQATLAIVLAVGLASLLQIARDSSPGHLRRAVRSAAALVSSASLFLPSVAAAGGGALPAFARFEWLLSDVVGSTVLSVDEHGDRLGQTVMEPFGRVHARVGLHARPRFGGHAEERRAGLIYMQARWMDPDSGRFVSIDPLVSDSRRPSSLNAYAYAENNPVGFADPTGREIQSAFLTYLTADEKFSDPMGPGGSFGSAAGNRDFSGAGLSVGTLGSISGHRTALQSLAGFDASMAGRFRTFSTFGENGSEWLGAEEIQLTQYFATSRHPRTPPPRAGGSDFFSRTQLLQLHQMAIDGNATASVVVGGGAMLAGFAAVSVDPIGNIALDLGVGVGAGEMSIVSLAAQAELQGGEVGLARLEFLAGGAVGGGGLIRSSVSLSSPGAAAGGGLVAGLGGFAFAGPTISIPLGNLRRLFPVREAARP